MIIKGKENKVLSIIKESVIANCLDKGYLPLVIMDGSPESFVNFAACFLATAETRYYLARYSYIPIFRNIRFLDQYKTNPIYSRTFKNPNFYNKLDGLIREEDLLDIEPAKCNDYLVASIFASKQKYKIIGNKCEDTLRCNLAPSSTDTFIYHNPLSFISHGEILQIVSTIEGYRKHIYYAEYKHDYEKEIQHLGDKLISEANEEGKYTYIGLLERLNRALDKGITISTHEDCDAEYLLKSDLIDKEDILRLMDLTEHETKIMHVILDTEKKLRACDPSMILNKRSIIKDCLHD